MFGNLEAIVQFWLLFDYFFVVINQQGIGKGLMILVEFEVVYGYMCVGLEKVGVLFDCIYICFDFKIVFNNCCKFSLKMGYQAKVDFLNIDFSWLVMVGDLFFDLQFGYNLGMCNVWVIGKLEDEVEIWVVINDGLFVWQII